MIIMIHIIHLAFPKMSWTTGKLCIHCIVNSFQEHKTWFNRLFVFSTLQINNKICKNPNILNEIDLKLPRVHAHQLLRVIAKCKINYLHPNLLWTTFVDGK